MNADIFEEQLKIKSNNYPRLTSKLLELSNADKYDDAKQEWRITGKTWDSNRTYNNHPNVLLELNNHPSNHKHHCLCGHNIRYHFEVENTITNVLEIVGSSCINNWMVLRHINEVLKIDKRTITEKMIDEWKQTAVQSLVKDSWWELDGEDFTNNFNNIKDLDLRINVKKTGKKYWDEMLKEYRPQTYIRKSSNGIYGHPDYQMASIVWRWNHPDNKRSQINSKRGFPNERLINDIAHFLINMNRILTIIQIEDKKDSERYQELALIDNVIRNEIIKTNENDLDQHHFLKGCDYFGIRPFTTGEARNAWERRFLRDMRRVVVNIQQPTEKQADKLINILNRRIITEEGAVLSNDEFVNPDDTMRM